MKGRRLSFRSESRGVKLAQRNLDVIRLKERDLLVTVCEHGDLGLLVTLCEHDLSIEVDRDLGAVLVENNVVIVDDDDGRTLIIVEVDLAHLLSVSLVPEGRHVRLILVAGRRDKQQSAGADDGDQGDEGGEVAVLHGLSSKDFMSAIIGTVWLGDMPDLDQETKRVDF